VGCYKNNDKYIRDSLKMILFVYLFADKVRGLNDSQNLFFDSLFSEVLDEIHEVFKRELRVESFIKKTRVRIK